MRSGMESSIKAVSYTHLDVYKRQLVGIIENRSARSLVYAAGLHAYDTVLYDIADTDAVLRCV